MDINALQQKLAKPNIEIKPTVNAPDMNHHDYWKAVYLDKQEIIDLIDSEIVNQSWGRSEGLQMAKAIINSATEYRWTQETVTKPKK